MADNQSEFPSIEPEHLEEELKKRYGEKKPNYPQATTEEQKKLANDMRVDLNNISQQASEFENKSSAAEDSRNRQEILNRNNISTNTDTKSPLNPSQTNNS